MYTICVLNLFKSLGWGFGVNEVDIIFVFLELLDLILKDEKCYEKKSW